MQLSDYPQAIRDAQFQLLAQEQKVRRLKDALNTFDREIEGAIAFDETLTNESKRKVRKAELMASEDYQGLLLDLRSAQDKQTELEIELEFLRSSFLMARLERREAIANMELAASQPAA